MSAPSDVRPDLEQMFDAFGVPATAITPPTGPAIETATVVWVPEFTEDAPPGGGIAQRAVRRVAAFRRREVPEIRMGTTFSAPLVLGEDARSWRIDTTDRIDSEHHRAIVVEVQA